MMIRLASWRRFGRDDSGVAAIEFAFLAPVLIIFFMGLNEVCAAYMAKKRMGHVTSMVADLAAQEEVLNTTNLGDIANIGGVIMRPFSAAPLSIRVSSVTRTNGVAKVDWSWARDMDDREDEEVVTLPDDLITDGQSIIMSEANYAYDSPIKDIIKETLNFKAVYYLRPRATDKILCSDC